MQFVLGTYLAERQRYQPAMFHLLQGLDGAQAIGDMELQADVLSNLASVYRELGDFDLAQRFQRQVLAIHGAADVGDLLGWSTDALLAGKIVLAEKLARNAVELVEDSEDLGTLADAYGLLGIIAARRGRLRRAMWLLIRAARGHQCVADDRGLAADYQNLAEISGLMHRFGWQRTFLSAAQMFFRRAAMPLSEDRVASRLRDIDRLELYRKMNAGWN